MLNISDSEQKKRFLKTEKLIDDCLSYKGQQTFLVNFILNGTILFEQNDPLWFAKGVCLGHIGITYIDLIKHHTLFGSWDVEDLTAEDSLVLSLEIIRYAYDLLTGYDGSVFSLMCREGTNIKKVEVTSALSIPRPDILTDGFFINGWTAYTPLFDAFLENIPLDSASLNQIPESAHMLMISLVYFSHRSNITASFAYSVLLCYVLLDLCSRNNVAVQDVTETSAKSVSEKAMPTNAECQVVYALTTKYFTASDSQLHNNVDRKTLHPLVQFQHCLNEMNHLNTLCASKYPRTIYYKTFNGSFIYNMMKQLEKETHPLLFLEDLLAETPTVLSLFQQLVQFYEECT
ncbi:hypothetical protein EVAR_54673_1 [Eumeta japonica]|uniref:Uncharacterized protein n=1 Tax=Eumeta variegata TaxID=151549 RepID=A0A4C1X944_EUMVA|nr:hypothetical protein EVAR_54673_1 [Eumeta japonica]